MKGRLTGTIVAILLAASALSGCAHARHVAVDADKGFSAAVFSLDETATQACQQHVLTPAQCAALNPKIAQALVDVIAVTKSLQATPKNVAVPKQLPDLLTDLTQVQAILAPASGLGGPAALAASRAQAALEQTIAIVRLFAQVSGGK